MIRYYNESLKEILDKVVDGTSSIRLTTGVISVYDPELDNVYFLTEQQIKEYNEENDFCIELEEYLTEEQLKERFENFIKNGSVYTVFKNDNIDIKKYSSVGFINNFNIKGDEK